MKKEKLTKFNQNNIIEAAEKLFGEKGVIQTTMDDIAKTAQYSKSTIYVYFKSKEEIYNHIVFKSMIMLKDRLKKRIEENNSYETTFMKFCNELVQFQEEHPLYFESITGFIGCEKEDFKEQPVLLEVYFVGEEINEMLINLIQEGMKDNYFRDDLEPLSAVLTLWASVCGIISMAGQKQEYLNKRLSIPKTRFLEYSFQMLLHSVRKGN